VDGLFVGVDLGEEFFAGLLLELFILVLPEASHDLDHAVGDFVTDVVSTDRN